jgi:hypothetical protein
MKRQIPVSLLTQLAAAVLLAQSVIATPSPEEVLDQHVKALGGQAAAKKLKTRHIKANFEMPAAGITADLEIIAKAPDKLLTIVNIPNLGAIHEGYDGKVAWSKNPFIGITEKSGAQLDHTRAQADFYRDVEIKDRLTSLTHEGSKSVNGEECHVISGQDQSGNTERMFISKKDYLIKQLVSIIPDASGATMEATLRMSDYRKVDGLMIPHKIEIVEPSQAAFVMTFTSVKHNEATNDSKFAKPAN